jgi:hypothetical protein
MMVCHRKRFCMGPRRQSYMDLHGTINTITWSNNNNGLEWLLKKIVRGSFCSKS